ncbi:MAG: triose-phosphate isomerase [Patescibacteria group bacterium]
MKKIIIANWKMQLTIKESLELSKQFSKKIKTVKNDVVICPDYSALAFVGPILKGTKLNLGAQDCAASAKGAYTGEVSAHNLKTLGVRYVILGHSERREHLHENSVIINNKIKAALAEQIIPILCIGEKLTEREAGETKEYLLSELRHALKGVKIKNASDLLIAYEPVWAISTNKNAKAILPVEAAEIQDYIKKQAKIILKKELRVLYGGSVGSKNAAGFLAQAAIDGLLVGGASLKINEFPQIVN